MFDLADIKLTRVFICVKEVSSFAHITSVDARCFTITAVFQLTGHIFATESLVVPLKASLADLTLACLCILEQHVIALAGIAHTRSIGVADAASCILARCIDAGVAICQPEAILAAITGLDTTLFAECAF